MKKILWILFVSVFTLQLSAQTAARGVVKDAGTGEPVIGVKVSLLQQNISTRTNADGEFYFAFLDAGNDELSFTKEGYFNRITMVTLKENEETDLGEIKLRVDIQAEAKQDIILQLSEVQLDDDESSQSMGGSFSSQSDVYISQTSYNFSPMRFRTRGYDNKYESTYINGVRFVDAERGGFNYSSIGGLNNATRNKDLTYGLTPNTYSFGNLGANTNINTRASAFATGSNASVALSNRAYKLRGQFTYGTGILPSGWAFAVSGVIRWADEGIIDGTFYNSGGLFLSAEKYIDDNHRLSLVVFGAPTRRAQQAALTEEAVKLGGSIYYNPYWGYQNGKKRNSRIVNSFDPTAILSHVWNIDDKQSLRSGIGFHYSMYSNSALNFYNAPDPRPDYYREMPSYHSSIPSNLQDGQLTTAETQEYLWLNYEGKRQLDWNELYDRNYYRAQSNDPMKDTLAAYSLERRHNNLMEVSFNSVYTNQISQVWKITAGVEGRYSKGMHYKTMEDLMGGELWIDIDQFAQRDLPADINFVQNDLNNPNKMIDVGDVFGYNYDMQVLMGSAFAQTEWNFSQVDIYAGLQGTYTQFFRYGHMKNGRAPENSYKEGKVKQFIDPSVKAGFIYNISGRNRVYANITAETNAPLVRDSYLSDRVKDTSVPNLTSEKILSYDLNYAFSYPFLRGRISAFRTHINDALKKVSYYDSEKNTFVHHTLSGVNKLFQGIELGLSAPIAGGFSVAAAGTFADYRYTDDAMGIISQENGLAPDTEPELVQMDNLKINAGPQLAANVTLSYFHPKMWFVDLTLNYFDNNYLDFAPNRRRKSVMEQYRTPEVYEKLGAQTKLQGGFMLDASIGKVIYLKDRRSLNFNLSMSNILNNTEMQTGGYQQARILMTDTQINTQALDVMTNKYYYAWGFNFFFNVGYRF